MGLGVACRNKRFLLASSFRRAGTLGLICLGTVSIWCQTRDLATTDDGSKLYFSSTLRLKGTDEYGNGKIFEYANGAYTLIAQGTPSATLSDGSAFQFALRMPSVSGDGTILTYDGTASCSGGQLCLGSFTSNGFIMGAKLDVNMTWFGSLRISHNGRYALRFGGLRNVLPYQETASFYDRQSGKYVAVLLGCTIDGDGRQSITDDGAVLTNNGLWRDGQLAGPSLSPGGFLSRISPDGSIVVYETFVSTWCYGDFAFGGCDVNNVLHARNVATGVDVQIAQGPTYGQRRDATQGQPYFFPSLSNDGRFVLYRAPDAQSGQPQVFLSTTDGTMLRKLTAERAGIAEAVLSGDGHRAYAVKRAGGLLSIDVDSGQVQTLPNPFRRTSATGALAIAERRHD